MHMYEFSFCTFLHHPLPRCSLYPTPEGRLVMIYQFVYSYAEHGCEAEASPATASSGERRAPEGMLWGRLCANETYSLEYSNGWHIFDFCVHQIQTAQIVEL